MEGADVHELNLQYLYSDGEHWHFMDESSFEQYAASADVIGEAAKWLKDQAICTITLWDGQPIVVDPPNFVTLEVRRHRAGRER